MGKPAPSQTPATAKRKVKTMMTLERIRKGAETRGLAVHESVTDERLSRVEPTLMEGHAIRGQKKSSRCGFDWNLAWGDRAFAVPYKIGEVGEEVIAPPKTDQQLALVVLPSYRVVAHVDGVGQTVSDVEDVSETHGLMWTVLRPMSD